MNNSLANGGDRGVGAVLDVEFDEQSFQVRLHGIFRDEERRGYFLVAASANKKLQHYQFALGQFGTLLTLSQALGQFWRQFFFARVHGANGRGEFIFRRVLQQVRFRAGIHGAIDVLVHIERGQYDHTRVGKFLSYGDRGFDTAHSRQSQIHERDIRLVAAKQLDGFVSSAGFRDDFEIAFGADQRGQPLAEGWVIVHQHNANRMFFLHRFLNYSRESGMVKIISVPRSRSLFTCNSPFNSPARSRMAVRPKLPAAIGGCVGSKPQPSSRTTRRNSFAPNSSFTVIRFAWAYFV